MERNLLAFMVDGGTPHPGTPPALSPSLPLERPLLPAQLALTAMQHLGNVATAIPNNGLFRQHPAIGSPFLGGDRRTLYPPRRFHQQRLLTLTSRLPPGAGTQTPGDGFYEQRLVREQVQHLIARP